MVYRPARYEQMMKAAETFDVRARRMCGGMAVYTGERMFAFLIGDDLGLKLSPEDQIRAKEMPGAGEIRSEPNAEPLRDYVRMPRQVLESEELLSLWVERSACFVMRKTAIAQA